MAFRRRLLLWALALGTMILAWPSASSPLLAQPSTRPSLRITRVDSSAFPDVVLYVSGSNLGAEIGTLPFTVLEDGEERDSVSEPRPIALQLALVLDASGSVLDPGLTNVPRHVEVGNAARRFVSQGLLSTDTDWLASYAIGADQQVVPVAPWTRDHQAVADSLYIYQPPTDFSRTTPLFNYIFFALESFDSPDIPPNASKAIVLFSDGEAGSSTLQLDDAIDRANALNVPIHTVLLGPGTTTTRANMERIATLTGGRTLQIDGEGALDALWPQIVGTRTQQVIAYRSRSASPREVTVSATLPDGSTVRAAAALPAIPVEPVAVEVRSPTPNTVVTRDALTHDAPLAQVEPRLLEIESDFVWPEGTAERDIERVEYILGPTTEVRTRPPFDAPFSFPIGSFDSGSYSLRVVATDELGIVSESEPVTIEVNVIRPPAPEPSVTLPLFGPVARSSLTTAANIGALLLGLLAVFIASRNPRVRETVSNTVGWVREKTVEFRRGKRDAIKAVLMVETNNGNIPPQLHISSDVTTIGRDPTLSTLRLDHPQVSRLHCQIVRQADGTLRIEDSGGSTGTYVNDQPINIDGTTLHSGDLIEIGPVHLRFYYKDESFEREMVEDPNRTVPVETGR